MEDLSNVLASMSVGDQRKSQHPDHTAPDTVTENVFFIQQSHPEEKVNNVNLLDAVSDTSLIESDSASDSGDAAQMDPFALRRDSDVSVLSCASTGSLASQGSTTSITSMPTTYDVQPEAMPQKAQTTAPSRKIHWAHPPADTHTAPSSQGSASSKPSRRHAVAVEAGDFEPERHFYPRVLNASIHPLVGSFFSLGNERILHRYTHLNPSVDPAALRRALSYQPKHFLWGGADLFNVTTAAGKRQMIVVETNSCPSGQKSMPLLHEGDELGGYGTVMRTAFRYLLSRPADRPRRKPRLHPAGLQTPLINSSLYAKRPYKPRSTDALSTHSKSDLDDTEEEEEGDLEGDLAVIYDKNYMEASGYAAAMADVYGERVWLVEFMDNDDDPPVRWTDDAVMQVRDQDGDWHSIRACFRYVTQRPWARIPVRTRTRMFNGTLTCLAGGRNKQMAARAYEFLNAELSGTGLSVRIPETKRNVSLEEVPLLVKSLGGHAVLKVPYSNAGQGVFTITDQDELDTFMQLSHKYEKFIVQSLVGNASWSSQTLAGRFYHVGTVPNRKNHTFVSDLRVMVAGDESGFRPIAIYGRRARRPLLRRLDDDPNITSWEMLGTNLSVKMPDGTWTTESSRLMLMDRKDFNQLGVGLDDLIDAYVQTILSVMAIDMMCQRLLRDEDGEFDYELFRALNPDEVLLSEILC